MENELLSEIRELKAAIAKLIGTSDLSPKQQFSKESLNRAAGQFQKLSIERGDWIKNDDIDKYIKNAPYGAGSFIIAEFGFSNYFKRGHTYYFYKKALIALAKELKKRNVNLERYMQYMADLVKFKKSLEDAAKNTKGKSKTKPFKLPANLKDFNTTSAKLPSADIVREDIKKLKDEFFEFTLSNYIDIYRENYAMLKEMYWFGRYLEPGLMKKCRKWCDNFNYANHALEELTKKREPFIPVKEEDMIEL